MRADFVGSRFFVAVLLLAVVAVFYRFHQPMWWSALTLLVAAGGAWEWARLCGFSGRDVHLYVGCFLLFAGLVSWGGGETFVQKNVFGMMALFWVLVVPWWALRGWRINRRFSAALGLLALYAAWSAVSWLYENDLPLLLAGMVLVWVFDSSCYFVGRAVGRTQMAPTISPKKTVEGLLGGFGVVLLGGVVYGIYFIEQKATLPLVLAAVFALAAVAAVGDLFVSLLKREAGIKDSGKLLGEHGGILDRTDSLLPVLPLVALFSPWIG